MLYTTSVGKQYSGAIPLTLSPSHRRIHTVVAGKAGPTRLRTEGPVVPQPKSAKKAQTCSNNFLRNWHRQVLAYQVPCHTPSFKIAFNQLCHHKQAISQWSVGPSVQCCCKHWSQYQKAAINPTDSHWVLQAPSSQVFYPKILL